MNSIVVPNEYYDFSSLHLATPISTQGGAYFTKLLNNNNDVYIQTPKSKTKQGFIKSGKKIQCDLMFDKSNGDFIKWFEDLENKIIDLIHSKSNSWFQDSIDKDDIENAFASPVRVYKSGNYYLVRCYVETPRMAQSSTQLTLFDENEKEINMEDINDDSNVVSILQIHGIKFTPKSFQIYIQVKQVMLISNTMFNNCLISTSNNRKHLEESNQKLVSKNASVEEKLELEKELDHSQDIIDTLDKEVLDNVEVEKENSVDEMTEPEKVEPEKVEPEKVEQKIEINNCNSLEEFDIDINLDNLETIELKKPDTIYYDIYLKAKEKAKNARKHALEAYLELKQIKANYEIDDMDDTDDEIEEIGDYN
tara:strand:- start:2902 stop:3996 length:1095 start_codon:yes stop_codon:yes gene_type:complete